MKQTPFMSLPKTFRKLCQTHKGCVFICVCIEWERERKREYHGKGLYSMSGLALRVDGKGTGWLGESIFKLSEFCKTVVEVTKGIWGTPPQTLNLEIIFVKPLDIWVKLIYMSSNRLFCFIISYCFIAFIALNIAWNNLAILSVPLLFISYISYLSYPSPPHSLNRNLSRVGSILSFTYFRNHWLIKS